jgi:ABC-type amino acid transport system permease subunit|nr:MAG TPA: ATP synthase B chain precursor-like protein [Caudoviricetes sp.]
MEFLINFLIFEIICIAILFIVVWVILTNYIISYLRDISRLVDKGFENIEKAIYDSAERIIKYLDKRD